MEKVSGYFQTLYQREEPHTPGLPLAKHVHPVNFNKDISSEAEAEVEAAVQCLRPYKVGGHTHLRAEHFNQWQREAYPGEHSKTSPRRERWACLVDLVHQMWSTREIPQELGCTILVLIPTGYHRHKRHKPDGDPVEGGGGTDLQSHLRHPTDVQRPPRVQVRKRYGYGYNGVKARSGACQNRPGPPLPGIPVTSEGLQYPGPGPTAYHTGELWSGSLHMWALGDFLE